MSFDLSQAELAYNNLGGMGPDSGPLSRPVARFVNAGTVYHPVYGAINIDMEVSNRSAYQPSNASLNGIMNGAFSRVSIACNTETDFRTTLLRSCTSGPSCSACAKLSGGAQVACYAEGCDCWGTTVYNPVACSGSKWEAAKASYGCAEMNKTLLLPPGALLALTAFALDTGAQGDQYEQLTIPEYAYFRTPLRAASGNALTSQVFANTKTRTFTGLSASTSELTSLELTDEQAVQGVQFFIAPENGYVDWSYHVSSSSPSCVGSHVVFAGDSALCAPPPPTPPTQPPLSPPSVPPCTPPPPPSPPPP